MRDTMKPFRKSIDGCLAGNVSYNGSPIPFYDEKAFAGQVPDIYGIYSTQKEFNILDTDCAWLTKSSIDIMLVARSGSEVSKDILDDISNSILELLLNLPGSDNLISQSGFQISELIRESATCGLFQITSTQSELRKLITLTANIYQQN